MKRCSSVVLIFGLLFTGLLAGGCPKTVNVLATDEICKNYSVEVHLVGVSKLERETWDALPMSDYWKPDNQLRRSAVAYTQVIKFGQGHCEEKIEPNHVIRGKWKENKAAYMFVLAHLPGLFDDQPGNADPRRLRLPQPGSMTGWDPFERKIDIRIERGQVRSLTIPKK
jgi:hypothetical protein